MDNYVLNQAYIAGDLPGFGFLARLKTNWRAKRAVNKLLNLDDHLLADAGLERHTVVWASHLPLSVNALSAMYDRAQMERFKQARR